MKNFWDIALKTVVIALIITGVKFYYKSKEAPTPSENLYSDLGGDFTLQSRDGIVHLDNFKGKPTILYFGFTSCPDICPLSLSRLNKALDKIDPSIHSKVNKVFISVDYKRDTPEKVQDYASHFGNYTGLTGSKEQIEDITKKYVVHFEFVELKNSAMKYTVDHTSRFYILNRKGRLINSFSDLINDPKFKEEILALTE